MPLYKVLSQDVLYPLNPLCAQSEPVCGENNIFRDLLSTSRTLLTLCACVFVEEGLNAQWAHGPSQGFILYPVMEVIRS